MRTGVEVVNVYTEAVTEIRKELIIAENRVESLRSAIAVLEPLAGLSPADPPPQLRKAAVKAEKMPKAKNPSGVKTLPRSPYKAAKPGAETCGQCGRTKLHKAMGRGVKGLTKFHHAEKCGLPCAGGSLSPASAEDLKGGKHSNGGCPKCDARIVYK